RLAGPGHDLTLKSDRSLLPGAVRPPIAMGSNPGVLKRLLDLIGTGLRQGGRSRDENGEITSILIPRMTARHAHGPHGDTDADVSEVDIVLSRLLREVLQYVILVCEADPLAVAAEDVHVGPTAQRPRRERGREISGLEVDRDAWFRPVHQDALT